MVFALLSPSMSVPKKLVNWLLVNSILSNYHSKGSNKNNNAQKIYCLYNKHCNFSNTTNIKFLMFFASEIWLLTVFIQFKDWETKTETISVTVCWNVFDAIIQRQESLQNQWEEPVCLMKLKSLFLLIDWRKFVYALFSVLQRPHISIKQLFVL